MTDVFEALAAPARRAILDVLCERDGRYKYHYLDTTPLNAIVKRWLTPKRKAGEE
jgi:DNA-binding transcriptional ArsR family regulator